MLQASVSERRVSAIAIALTCVVFVALLLAVPAFLPSFDEAKYLGIGSNVLAGHGVVSVYGPFLDHSPLWPVMMVGPGVLAGIDPLSWGHILDGIAGVGLLLLVAWFGWRFRPAAGALGATVLLGFTYLHDLTRTARLDVPAATLALLFVAVGITAIRRDSIRWGVLAGAIFAVAFLVKEIALPFAPVPLIAGLLAGRPLAAIARVNGAMLLTAALGTSWWFIVFASYTHQVYRLGLPALTLAPIAVVVVVVGVACLAARRIATTSLARSISGRAAALTASSPERWRLILGWALAVGWFVLLDIAFARSQGIRGLSLLSLAQWRAYAAAWLTPITLAAAGYALGALLAFWAVAGGRLGRGATPVVDLTIALICSMPLVLLVVAVGEPPRNYLAQIGLVVALASCGWVWLAGRVATRLAPSWERARGSRFAPVLAAIAGGAVGALCGVALAIATHVVSRRTGVVLGVVVGVAIGSAIWIVAGRRASSVTLPDPVTTVAARSARRVRVGLAVALIVPLLVSSAILADHVRAHRGSATGAAELAAVATVTKWIDANVPSGSTIAFGSYLGYQMSLSLDRPYTITQIAQEIVQFMPGAPLGIGVTGKPLADDWISVDTAPRNVAEFQAFRASGIANRIRTTGATYWIYTIGTPTSAQTLIPAIEAAAGLTEVARWNFPYPRAAGGGSGALTSYAFKIDPTAVSLDPGRLFIAPDALDRLLTQLEATPGDATTQIAARLLDRVRITPSGAGDAALLDRLHHLAGH